MHQLRQLRPRLWKNQCLLWKSKMTFVYTEVGIYKRKLESKKTRIRPRKRSRKQENKNSTKKATMKKIKNFLFFLIPFLVEFLFSDFLVIFFKIPTSVRLSFHPSRRGVEAYVNGRNVVECICCLMGNQMLSL